jgi:hypothetical protein
VQILHGNFGKIKKVVKFCVATPKLTTYGQYPTETGVNIRKNGWRWKIEFLFRDAIQFSGLTHCQARAEAKLDFYFNMSLAAINLVQVYRKLNPTITSMNSFVHKAYNLQLVEWLFERLSSEAKFDLGTMKK